MEETLGNQPTPANQEKTQQAADDLRVAAGDKAQQLKQNAIQKAQQLRELAGTKATDIKDTAKVKAQQIKHVAGDQVQSSKDKAKEFHTEAEIYIRKNPTKSVLTALGAGFLIGLIIRK